jgi:hypothetical protein
LARLENCTQTDVEGKEVMMGTGLNRLWIGPVTVVSTFILTLQYRCIRDFKPVLSDDTAQVRLRLKA